MVSRTGQADAGLLEREAPESGREVESLARWGHEVVVPGGEAGS